MSHRLRRMLILAVLTFTAGFLGLVVVPPAGLAASATARIITVYADGRTSEEVRRIKRRSITFAPDFGLASKDFKPVFPNGTHVDMMDLGRGVEFQWEDGKPLPK